MYTLSPSINILFHHYFAIDGLQRVVIYLLITYRRSWHVSLNKAARIYSCTMSRKLSITLIRLARNRPSFSQFLSQSIPLGFCALAVPTAGSALSSLGSSGRFTRRHAQPPFLEITLARTREWRSPLRSILYR